jgi:hypothetical protein
MEFYTSETFRRSPVGGPMVKPRLRGRAFLVGDADDLVMGFACEHDARRVLDRLPLRFGKYGLTIQTNKTWLVRFIRPNLYPPRMVAFRPVQRSGFLG